MTIKMKGGMTYEKSTSLISDGNGLISKIEHGKCQDAMENHWIKRGHAGVTAQSICWLYCWAATGMGSAKAQRQAEAVFNTIFDKSYDSFNPHTMHEYAEKHRYKGGDIEKEFADVAANSLIIK
jgi:hypothetical protein